MSKVPQKEVLNLLEGDCHRHRRTVADAVAAFRNGQIEHELLVRICTRELHSSKGVAGVLGLERIVSIVGELCQGMNSGLVPRDLAFFEDFEHWFTSLLACSLASATSDLDENVVEALVIQRDRLAVRLSPVVTEARPQQIAELSPSAGRRLLFVDDSPTVRFSVAAKLSDRGYPVETAKNLSEVAQLLRNFDPEIVVTDVSMPDVEGDELCRRIKAHMTRLVPVILYSGLPEQELSKRADAAGADGFVSKDHGIPMLIRRMDEILSEQILL